MSTVVTPAPNDLYAAENSPDLLLWGRGIDKQYGATKALDSADISVKAGEVHGLVGANGAGKSTLVKIFSGAVRPDRGELALGGWTGTSLTPRQAQQLGIATIYQDPSLVPSLAIAENVVLGRERTVGGVFLPFDSQRPDVKEVLDRVGLQADLRRTAGALAPAERQLLEIAKALYRGARVIIMDEPSAVLGPAELTRLVEVVADLRARGTSILYISHRLEEVLSICDRVSVFRDGRRVLTAPTEGLGEEKLVGAMIGREVKRIATRSSPIGPTVFQARALGQGSRLRDIDLDVREGEVVGMTGLVGSGRSRLARVLAGVESSDQGEMTLFGEPYHPRSPADAIERGVALVPEDRKREGVVAQVSVAKNVTLGRMLANRLGLLRARAEREAVRTWLERLQVVPPTPHTKVSDLSGGNQQKVSIARCLHADARFLIFDEPGQGVDVGAKAEILRAIRDLASAGRAILVVSSEWEELAEVADRVLVMRRGAIAGEIERQHVTEERVLELAMGFASIEALEMGKRR